MKNLLLGAALCLVAACASDNKKMSMSDADAANAPKAGCCKDMSACTDAEKAACATKEKAACTGEKKVCPVTGTKVDG